MPRYFLHQLTKHGLIHDHEGSELRDLEEARLEAIKDARHIMADAVRSGRNIVSRSFQVHDEAGNLLLVIPFSEAISIHSSD